MQAAEVKHLFNFISKSHCTINRNGTEHLTENAGAHIQKKYDYYREDIETTEDFIALSATKSMMSGNYYTVTSKNTKPINVQDWLLTELKRYRESITN